jgi:thiamine biosynthesis lipoprotein
MSVNCTGGALVTSGVYERYYTVDGTQYHHIISPETLMPTRYYKAVTILCGDSGLADGLTTALFNMPLAKGLKLIEALGGDKTLGGVEALWVTNDGAVVKSPGFDQYVYKPA